MASKLVVKLFEVDGEGAETPVGIVNVPSKDFKTGSKGFYASTKLEVGGGRYQTSVQLVLIGSKPVSEEHQLAKLAAQQEADDKRAAERREKRLADAAKLTGKGAPAA